MSQSDQSADPAGRRALIDATVASIEEDGLAGVSLRSIARRAAVSHAAPGHFFRDKAGLFTAVAIEGFALLEKSHVEALATTSDDPVDRLQAMAASYVTFGVEHRAHFEVMHRLELVHPDDPELQSAALAAFKRLHDATQAAVDAGFAPGWAVDDLTMASWAFVHGIVQLTSHGVLGGLGFPADAAELTTRLTRLVNEAINSVMQR